MNHRPCLLFAACLLFATAASAQNTAFPFQTFNLNPYAFALGEATVAQRGYGGAASINPATIGQNGSVRIHTPFDTGSGLSLRTPWLPAWTKNVWLLTPGIDVKYDRLAFAYSFKELDFGRKEFVDAQGNPIRNERVFDRSHKLTAAYDLTRHFSAGVAVNFIRSHLVSGLSVGNFGPRDVNALSFDAGVYYERPLETAHVSITPALGWSITDFGGLVHFAEDAPVEPMPIIMRGGASVGLATRQEAIGRPIATLGLYGALSKDIVREDYRYDGWMISDYEVHGPFRALFTSWKVRFRRPDGFIENIPLKDQLRKHGGVELSLLRILSFRWGHRKEDERLGPRHFSSWGWGLDLYYLALDHAHFTEGGTPYQDTSAWTLSARIPLSNSPDNFWPSLIRNLRTRM